MTRKLRRRFYTAGLLAFAVALIISTARRSAGAEWNLILVSFSSAVLTLLIVSVYFLVKDYVTEKRMPGSSEMNLDPSGWLETVLSSMSDAILVVSNRGSIVCMNESALRLFGLSAEDIKGQHVTDIFGDRKLINFINKTILAKEVVKGEILYLEDLDIVLTISASFVGKREESPSVVFTFHDVTALKELEHTKKDFVANVSHELKTPITAIKGFVETLKKGAINQPEDAGRFIDIIERHADRLHSIVEDLLLLSKLEQELESKTFILQAEQIRPVLESAVNSCENKLTEKGMRVEVECNDAVIADINPTLIERAVSNLIDNAVKYSETTRPIRLSCLGYSKEIVITVEDSGIGIPKKHIPYIFSRFYRVDKSRSRELGGTGLGLAIVKQIIDAHNGSIRLESDLDKGCKFIIRLPVKNIQKGTAVERVEAASQKYYRRLIKDIYTMD